MKPITIILIFFIILSITACSNLPTNLPSNDDLLQQYTKQEGRECIRDSDIRGFGVLDDDVISVDSRTRDAYYLMTTLYRCHSLNTSFQVAFDGSFAEFCGGGKDKVLTGDESCPVKNIYKFESREQAFEAFDFITAKRKELSEELTKEK